MRRLCLRRRWRRMPRRHNAFSPRPLGARGEESSELTLQGDVMEPNNIPQQEAEFFFRRLTEPINLGIQAFVADGFWLALLIGAGLAALVYLVWMAAREGRINGWPWACFRIGSRLLSFLALAAAALIVRAGVSDSEDTFRVVL